MEREPIRARILRGVALRDRRDVRLLPLARSAKPLLGVTYGLARRTREAGIRLAVGAQPGTVVRLLMREGVTLVAVGSVIGLVLGFAISRVLGTLLYGVGAIDPLAFIGAPLVLGFAGLLAAFLPARRAGRIDPAKVLRSE